jgi:Na+/H+ antiporter
VVQTKTPPLACFLHFFSILAIHFGLRLPIDHEDDDDFKRIEPKGENLKETNQNKFHFADRTLHTGRQVNPVYLVVCLLTVLVALVNVARRLDISSPIVLVIGGLLLALFPRLPEVKLEPEIVFLVFLPPLLFWDALNSSWRDFRDNRRPISFLALGLVFASTMAVMLVSHFMLGFLWPTAFVLGAVLGPTDTVAASAILERFNLPRRLLSVLRGESLLNDALALVLYETAVRVTQTRMYVLGSVSIGFLLAAAGGVAIGLAVGWTMLRIQRLTADPLVRSTIGLLTGYAAYLPADALHVSGVLAVVAAGLYLGWEDPRIMSAKTRLQSIATWEVVTFLLNGLLFILIGLQLRTIVQSLSAESYGSILYGCLLVSGTVILIRILWVFISTYIARASGGRRRTPDPYPAWHEPVLISWIGIRGGISLAAALAIPTSLANGSPFPGRNEILILTFAVILVTLVLQGLSLPYLLRWLNFPADGAERTEEQLARETISAVALQFLASTTKEDETYRRAVRHLQESYRKRAEGPDLAYQDNPETQYLNQIDSLERELIRLQRSALIDLRDRGNISDAVLRRSQVLLDLEEARLEEQERHFQRSESPHARDER